MVGILALLAGCMPGPQPETLVDDLLVVAVVPSTPEVGAGETVTTEIHLGLPNDTPVDLLVWSCFPLGEDTCLETGTENRVTVFEGAPGVSSVDQTVPVEIAGLLTATGEEFPIFLWSMACESGLCPLIEDAKAGTVSEDRLVNPINELKTLPFDGVSLAARTLWLSGLSEEERRKNPVVEADFEVPTAIAAGESISLAFSVEEYGDTIDAFGYSLTGGFGAISSRVFEGQVVLDWFAPEEVESSETTQVWVVFQGEAGGTAVWSSEWMVEGAE